MMAWIMRVGVAVCMGGIPVAWGEEALLSVEDLAFLRAMTSDVVEASRVAPEGMVGAIGPNATGGTLIRPGGRDCYPAFWIRDYAKSLDSGLITVEEQRHALLLTAEYQSDRDRVLESGSVVVAGSIPDHITFGGKPIYYPGVLDDVEGQGGPRWGLLPCLDDQFFFIAMAHHYVGASKDTAILSHRIRDMSLIQRLEEAFAMPPSRPDTHLVYAERDRRGVNFGFFDTVVHTGDLLFASLLKHRAAIQLAKLERKAERDARAGEYERIAIAIREAIVPVFGDATGLLRASTGVSAQLDVWGTAFAVHSDALTGEARRRACEALARAYIAGTIAWEGMIRHVPTTGDFSATSAWETAYAARNTYQNGAYWATPTGWVCRAIGEVDRTAAQRLAREYINRLRTGDFRLSPEHGAPWECEHPDNAHRQNPVYMTSVTCPLAAFVSDGRSK